MNRIWHYLLLAALLSAASFSQAQDHDEQAVVTQPATSESAELPAPNPSNLSDDVLIQDGMELLTVEDSAPQEEHAGFAPQPFRAEYAASYNDDRIGRAWLNTILEDDVFHTEYRMKATRGFASFIGANLREQGRYGWQEHTIIPLYFKHRSKAFLSKKKWHANYDAVNGRVSGEYEGDAYDLPFEPGLLDPQTQLVFGAQLSAQLSRSMAIQSSAFGKVEHKSDAASDEQAPDERDTAADVQNPESMQPDQEGDFDSVVKGALRRYHYALFANQTLNTECGEFSTVRLLRTRAESTATQEMWYAPELDWLMVRMRIVQRDGDVLDMLLSGAELSGELACGTFEEDDD